MGIFHKLQVGDKIISPIDWEMNPDISFGTFESWGGRERVRSNSERIYYFFIDNWGETPKLCLMERGVKHAEVIAEIRAPADMVKECVQSQGSAAIFEKSYAINDQVRDWLIENVLDDNGDSSLVIPRKKVEEKEDMGPGLPDFKAGESSHGAVALPNKSCYLSESDIPGLLKKWSFFDRDANPEGRFTNDLVAWNEPGVVIDKRTSLMWQQGGLDINSIRRIQLEIEARNKEKMYGFADWRLPTMEEAMSLMEPEVNEKGVYLASCFSKEQPFIFVDARRKPGGYWFVDYKQGRPFWSSGTIPGGFARLVRSLRAGQN